MDGKELKDAIALTMAEKIIGALGDEARAALLRESLTEALKDYTFRHAVQKHVSDAAGEAALVLLQTEEWQVRIRDAVIAGLDKYLDAVPDAVLKTLCESLHGTTNVGSYGSSGGLILKHLKP